MIVVEGPDGAGKSTLTMYLSEVLGFPIAPKIVRPDMVATADKKQYIQDTVVKGFQPIIWDRFALISETVYNVITKPHPEPGFDDAGWMRYWTRNFYSFDPVIIYCLPSLRVVKENVYFGEVDNKAPMPYIEKLYASYAARAAIDEAMKPSQVLHHDYTTMAPEMVLPIIRRRLREG